MENKSARSSEALFENYGSAIVALAHQLVTRGAGRIQRAELVSYGVEGMLQAARRYDPASGVQFWTFAYTRVYGAMLDAIRDAMPVANTSYRRLKAAEAALASTAPGTPEHALATRRLAEENEAIGLRSPAVLAITRGEELGIDEDVDPADDDPTARVVSVEEEGVEARYERAELVVAMRDAMRGLTVQERMVLRGLYFEDRGLLEIGAELGVSKSWASRIHTRALHRLKDALAREWGYEPDDAPVWRSQRDWMKALLSSGSIETIETEDEETDDAANAA
jgi:RNA polymerase sigma factor for flagellar operon FliA